jgi:hypothetical protein
LKRPTDTRWSSSLNAARRLLELKSYINLIIANLEESNWNALSLLIEILTPFETATNAVQSNHATLYTAYNQFVLLLKHAEEIDQTTNLENATQVIKYYWYKYIHEDLVICCAMLSFDKSYAQFKGQKTSHAKTWLTNFAKSYILQYHCRNDNNAAEVMVESFQREFLHFQGRSDVFSDLTEVISAATFVDETTNTSYIRPKLVWYHYVDSTCILALIGLALTTLPTSEAAVERSFGQQGIVHRKLRNRMGEQQIENEMVLKFNFHITQKQGKSDLIGLNKIESEINLFDFNEEEEEAGMQLPPSDDEFEKEIDDFPTSSSDTIISPTPSKRAKIIQENDSEIPAILPTKRKPTALYVLPVDEYNAINDFISKYVEENNITSSYRWTEHRLNQLQLAASNFSPTILDTIETLKKKLMKLVKEKHLDHENHEDTSKTNNINGICNVCKEGIDIAIHWHQCHGCGKHMHGPFACTKSSMMVKDDDLLYCSTICRR